MVQVLVLLDKAFVCQAILSVFFEMFYIVIVEMCDLLGGVFFLA